MAKGPASDLICVGAVTGPRGLKGEVKVKTFTATPKAIGDYGDVWDEAGERSFTIRVTGNAKGDGVVLARLGGVDDRNAAEAMKGVRLYVPKTMLPEPDEDEYYFADLIGLRAETEDGEDFGKVAAVNDFGAGPVIEVGGGEVGSVMLAFTKAIVPVVDLQGGRIVIAPPDGLFDPVSEEEMAEQAEQGE
ncbi:MAG: 16S rRNA processing protein RimM [Rhodospirillaceae bacterium]|jgi:16S rRNA processing protein RimM|nr:16S rRNA processing protein RimM [Rhodospirillaceae bacterium]MBT4218625.1 16S rRNA processing protein RimM [Rhodospirillaceae bacterium]MBT4464939.1 16S rRNA processing protein RimM [Rhodospirillaceae bacterium]MBT5013291.1 16S rRNA processing protein RimM [Rhodospirillaceae bacterium]MBT6407009.1 16S rRNA processing protein RimM [Rhodospirillaceae bacterium]